MKEKRLTEKQKIVLDYVKKYTATHGYPPAIREICEGINLSSPATVFVHLKNLESLGYIKKTSNKFRTIEILCENEYADNKDVIVEGINYFQEKIDIDELKNANVKVANIDTFNTTDDNMVPLASVRQSSSD